MSFYFVSTSGWKCWQNFCNNVELKFSSWDLFFSSVLVDHFSWINTFPLCIVQESIGEEVIADVILTWETCYNSMGKRGHFSDGISFEIGNDMEGNYICNDWMETFCE